MQLITSPSAARTAPAQSPTPGIGLAGDELRVAPANLRVVGQALVEQADMFNAKHWVDLLVGAELGRFGSLEAASRGARGLGADLPSVAVLAAANGAFTVNELLVAHDSRREQGTVIERPFVLGEDPIVPHVVVGVRNFEPSADRGQLVHLWFKGGNRKMEFDPKTGAGVVTFQHF